MRQDYVLSVTQLNEYVANLIGNDALLAGLSLRGEISGFKRHSSGHLYFSMKDESALVRCVMFSRNAMTLKRELRDGMQIVARGSASLYTRDGQFQFYVKSVEDEGDGELFRRFMLLKARLEATGMFDPAHKREIPKLPKAVGVVTSATGAAIQDIVNIIRRRYPAMDIILCPAQVQGTGAEKDIAEAVRAVEADGRADLIIVGRGGGSLEDLWAFNGEVVAKAIYACSIPVISAVGHETDFTIADFAADLRAPTPSAAAELCVPVYEAESADVEALHEKLTLHARRALEAQHARLEAFRAHGAFASPGYALKSSLDALGALEQALKRGATEMLADRAHTLGTAKVELTALGPQITLERGFALIRTPKGAVDSISGLEVGKGAKIVMHDGSADVTVDSIQLGGGG